MQLGGCGGCGDELDAKAEGSLARLGEQEREAARILVLLEQAAREEDATTLCRLYLFSGSARACEASIERLLDRQDTMALEIGEITLRGDRALVSADVTVMRDCQRSTDRYSMRLVRDERVWKVKWQD
jgi:hypothetical protein